MPSKLVDSGNILGVNGRHQRRRIETEYLMGINYHPCRKYGVRGYASSSPIAIRLRNTFHPYYHFLRVFSVLGSIYKCLSMLVFS